MLSLPICGEPALLSSLLYCIYIHMYNFESKAKQIGLTILNYTHSNSPYFVNLCSKLNRCNTVIFDDSNFVERVQTQNTYLIVHFEFTRAQEIWKHQSHFELCEGGLWFS